MEKDLADLTRRLTRVEADITRLTELLEERAASASEWGVPLQIVDQRGHTVLQVQASEDSSFLHLFNSSGEPVITLSAGEGGGELSLYGGQGRQVFALSATSEGASLDMLDPIGQKRIELISDADGGLVRIRDHSGRCVISLTTRGEGGELSLHDSAENRAAVLWVTKDGGELTLFNKMRQIVVAAGAEVNGGRLWVLDELGRKAFPWLAWGSLLMMIYLIQLLIGRQRGSDLPAFIGSLVFYFATVAGVRSYGEYLARRQRGEDDNIDRMISSQQSRMTWPVILGSAILPGVWIGLMAQSTVLVAVIYLLIGEALIVLAHLVPHPRTWPAKPHIERQLCIGMFLAATILAMTGVRRVVGW